jgi:hypothetical protein
MVDLLGKNATAVGVRRFIQGNKQIAEIRHVKNKPLPKVSLSQHLIYLLTQKQQASISFEIGYLPCPNPVVDGLLLYLQDF